jgi:hypothetical protein
MRIYGQDTHCVEFFTPSNLRLDRVTAVGTTGPPWLRPALRGIRPTCLDDAILRTRLRSEGGLMTVFSIARRTCCMTLTLGILIGLADRATAASIVQVVHYQLQDHDTQYGYYDQFDTKLGTLLDVMIRCQGSIPAEDAYTFNNSSLLVDQTFTGTVTLGENSDGGTTTFSHSFTSTLAPGGYVQEGYSDTSYDLSHSYGPDPFWVGTGMLFTSEYAFLHGGVIPFSLSASSNNPNIFIDGTWNGNPYAFYSDAGTETVTYVYQPAGFVPEPPAYVMLLTAWLVLLAVRYCVGVRTWG